MSFLRTLLIFVFVFSLVGVSESFGKFSELNICLAATTFDRFNGHPNPTLIWKKNDKFKHWVSLAKEKQLNCGVGQTLYNFVKNEDSRPIFYVGHVCSSDYNNCYGSKVIRNNRIFVGAFKFGKMFWGNHYFPNNSSYQGCTPKNKPYSRGSTFVYPNGHIYVDKVSVSGKTIYGCEPRDGYKYEKFKSDTIAGGNMYDSKGNLKEIKFEFPYCSYKSNKLCNNMGYFSGGKIFIGAFEYGNYSRPRKGLLYQDGKFSFVKREWGGKIVYLRSLYNNKKENNQTTIASNKTKDPSKRPLASVSDTSVCYNATKIINGSKVWKESNYYFVGLAKYRGLDCGVKIAKSNNKNNYENYIKNATNSQICSWATVSGLPHLVPYTFEWSKEQTDLKYLKEVKRRSLKCNVKENINQVIAKLQNKTTIASNKTKDPNKRPLASVSDTSVCYNATTTSGGKKVWNDRNDNFVGEAKYRGLDCGVIEDNKTIIASKPKPTKPSISSAELEKEKQKRIALQRKAEEEERKRKALEQRIAELEKKNKELQQPKKKQPEKPKSGSGSGFFISKLGHIITNQHVVNKCNKITIGDHIDKQVPAKLLEADRVNDLALLRTTNIKMASAETQSLIRKLAIEIVPLASGGLMRKSDVKGGEDVIVAGFPYGVMFSKEIKVTFGNVNSTKGIGDDSSQFQIQAPVQPGNSGGPIYDRYGNIVGVVVSQLNKFKLAKSIGSLPENVNFGIKASTVSQFLNSSGVITNWSKRTQKVSNEKIFEIASKQTVMVVCHR